MRLDTAIQIKLLSPTSPFPLICMGFFNSWENALRKRSEGKSMEMRKDVLIGELRNLQASSGELESKRIGSIIDSILDEKMKESKLSEIEKLVLELEDHARSGKSLGEILSKIEEILH